MTTEIQTADFDILRFSSFNLIENKYYYYCKFRSVIGCFLYHSESICTVMENLSWNVIPFDTQIVMDTFYYSRR